MKRLAYIAMMLLVSGCATQAVIEHRNVIADVSQLHTWSAQGRMGITGVPQPGSGSFRWRQHDAISEINLHGPLGVGAVSVKLDHTLHITLSNGLHYDSDDAETELTARLGTHVPVQQLKYWLRGIPAPGASLWMDDTHKVLQQDGWIIEYNDSMIVDSLQLPRKITATHDGTRIRVVIEEWTLQ
jgi:outer membrane lipoprotein LolB